ncbi:type VII secretion integral membrane protein EccD [Actinoplanes teichomyceticus]|uniref:Type VII secretion integral membrane protein EccD n=1 Tax=Actinoplanes teichomyceticus TaxID=1867 RepID=A0A561WB97_ACTTI|nr:type VII secretion integral membrane protein EccD [Actinoplanes teichomyceticus]TWG21131.1 type VII secretion integral membrane protein EccD [Actinoplanes teichomyceticus]
MTSNMVGGLTRVTIVAPRTRMDLALPADVPMADLLPTLLGHAGEDLADEGAKNGGWSLNRLGQAPLDSSRTPLELEIRDGEVLYFTPRNAAAPEVLFDDVVDAVATGTQNREGRWEVVHTRRFAAWFAAAMALAGAVALLFAGPPQLPGALVGLLAAVALLATAAVLSRAAGHTGSATLVALTGLGYATVGGLLVLAGDRELTELAAPHLLLAATTLMVAAAAATVAVGASGPLFLGTLGVAGALGLGTGICLAFGVAPAAGAAVAAALAFALVPALPMLAYRLARLPIPSIPTGPEDLKTDDDVVDGQRILQLSDRADRFLTGLIATVAAIIGGASLVLVLGGRTQNIVLCAVLALLLMLRARPLLTQAQRLPMLGAGSLALALAAYGLFQHGGVALRLTAVVGGLVAAAAASLIYGTAVAGRRISPVWGRLLDIAEILLIVAVVPLVAWVCGLYGWILTVRS